MKNEILQIIWVFSLKLYVNANVKKHYQIALTNNILKGS